MSQVGVAEVGVLVGETISRLREHVGSPTRAGVWSPVQTLDHLVQVHRGVVLGLRAKETLPARPVFLAVRRRVVAFVLRNAIPVPAKGAMPTCAADADFEAMAAELLKLQEKLEKRASEGVDSSLMVVRHPVGGPLNFHESMAFVHAHLLYHYKRAGK